MSQRWAIHLPADAVPLAARWRRTPGVECCALGDTLWLRGRLSGIIDWEQVRRGDSTQDVACCRLDLTLLFGPEAAELFLGSYLAASARGVNHLAFWDLFVASGAIEDVDHWVEGYHDLGRTDVTGAVARARLERFAAEALAEAANLGD